MLGASFVDEHSIAALAAQRNQLLNALLLGADRCRLTIGATWNCFVACSSSGPAQWWRRPLRRANLHAGSALLSSEIDRLISHQLPAMFEQRWLPSGHYLSKSHLKRLAPAVVAPRLEVQHLTAIADPALLRRQRRSAGTVRDFHLELLVKRH